MFKRAIILAGGKGSRLKPYTVVLPKPLMPVGEYPILEVVIRQLAFYDFEHITLAVNHQAEIIKSYFNSGEKWGVFIDYSMEKTPLGTMGPLRLIKGLPENFLVMNGDVLTDLDFREFYDYHIKLGKLFTISSSQRTQKSDYGVLNIDKSGNLSGFQEKPEVHYDVSMGVYMLSKKVIDIIPAGAYYGFDQLMHKFLQAKLPINVKKHSGFWLDIGRPDDYRQAISIFENNGKMFLKE
jgi:NDP-sugar pyrophosphorylase family protein